MPRKQVDEKKSERAVESTVMLVVPYEEPNPDEYQSRHVEVNALTAAQASALRAVVLGCQVQQEKLANGRLINTPVDAVRWLLEQVESAATSGASGASGKKAGD